ncbi:MAG: ribonuclease P protein subunit [Candidatus Thorarchaeota archaeon]|nr:MAG: ribonuclease P protein subunit [Candidatus Thorarchaeota archaeon]
MKISPAFLTRHEIIGLHAHVVNSTDKGHVSRRGVIEHESREMIHLSTKRGVIRLPKSACVFDLKLNDSTVVRVDGRLLKGTPDDRLKKRQSRRW